MPVPEDQRFRFFVYIVESPSPVDMYHGRGEGQVVSQAVALNLIPAVSRVAITREAFEAALKVGIAEAMAQNPGLAPIIHLSAHGNTEGIGLSSGEHITWNHLRDLLKPINKALSGALVVCLSCCEGYAGIRMAMHHDSDPPYFALIGNTTSPTWSETAIAYATLYHQIAKGEYFQDAVAAMCHASGNGGFVLENAETSKRVYLDYLATLNPASAQEQLRLAAANLPPSELAKASIFTQ